MSEGLMLAIYILGFFLTLFIVEVEENIRPSTKVEDEKFLRTVLGLLWPIILVVMILGGISKGITWCFKGSARRAALIIQKYFYK